METKTIIQQYAPQGVEIVLCTLIVTVVLELYSIDTVKAIIRTQQQLQQTNSSSDDKSNNNKRKKTTNYWFYCQAIIYNLVNHIGLGIPAMIIASSLFCTKDNLSIIDRIFRIFGIIFIHAILYYKIHQYMHIYPILYRIHKFHHRFNTYVTPIAANAVTPMEYVIAYLLPFAVAMYMLKPDIFSIRIALHITSFLNIIVHTPAFEKYCNTIIPLWLVSTFDHLEHHRKLTMKYASPTFNIDYLIRLLKQNFEKEKLKETYVN